MMSPREVARLLPRSPGVYRFRGDGGRVLYIGRATDLRSRVGSYWGDLEDRRHLRRMVPLIVRVEAVACASVHEAAWLERNLLQAAKPRWNRVRGGMETATVVLLDGRERTAGLRIAYDDAAPLADGVLRFGPYLGGLRTRGALAALHRVHPIAYCGSALTASERELGAVLGVADTDRLAMAKDLAAILARDPAAVEACARDLIELRDRAAACLRFEVAAQINEELDALAWITSTQRVATLSGDDAMAHGWADGTLVTLAITAGRLSKWSQARCTEGRGAALVAATPQAWQSFASDAAVLAVSLVTV